VRLTLPASGLLSFLNNFRSCFVTLAGGRTFQLNVESASALHISSFLHFHLVPFFSASDQSPTPHPHLNEHRQNRCPCKTQNSFSEFHTPNDSRPCCRSANAATRSCACKVSCSDSIVYDLLFEMEHLPGNNC
jgi:hypothetical protein